MYYKALVMQDIGHNRVFTTIPGEFESAESFRRELASRYHGTTYQILRVERITRADYYAIRDQTKRFLEAYKKPVA